MTKHLQFIARDPPALLRAMMFALAGDAQISFEGDLSAYDFASIGPQVAERDCYLFRNTIDPVEDFVVLPLNADTVKPLWNLLAASVPVGRFSSVSHVQIGRDGKVAFSACDWFHQDTVGCSDAVPEALIASLMEKRIITPYRPSKHLERLLRLATIIIQPESP